MTEDLTAQRPAAGEAACRALGLRNVSGGHIPKLGRLGRVERQVPR